VEKLVKFIFNYKSYITFFICLFLSTLLLFSNNSNQVIRLRSILVDLSSIVSIPISFTSQVLTALKENKQLKEENYQLQFHNSLLRQKEEEIIRLKELLELKETTAFGVKLGTIIAWGAVPIPHTITINLGEEDGIRKNSPVISSRGFLAGKVLQTGKKTSICQLLTDRNFKVSSIAQNSRAFGLLQWNHDDFAVMEVRKSLVVEIGDTVVTSEHGNIYPEGIRIGVIDSFEDGPGLFKIVNVKLFTDYLQIRDIAVIIDAGPF